MANDEIKIQFEGLEEFIALLDSFSRTVENELIKEMNKYKSEVEKGTKLLTPVDTNELTKSITSSDVKRNGNEYYFTVGSDLPYALRMHEHTGNWGVRTQLKQMKSYRGYTPGKKYLENAIRATESDWERAMNNVLDNTIRRGNI